MKMQLALDILLTLNIAVKSLTSFQKEVDYVKDIPEIVLNYAKGTMVFDIASTVPALFKDGNTQWFHLKLIRFIHVRSVYGWLSDVVRICLNRFGLDKGSVEKSSHIINLIIYIFSAIHIIGCAWIAVAMIVKCSWLDDGGCGAGIVVDRSKDTDVYITSIYWVITTLTTVGYGDYKGYTPTEYVLQMGVEFLGIGIFSYLMGSINNLVGSEQTLQDIIDERIEDIERWLAKLEKARPKNF